jgi:AraC-like DNA-binding protein
MVDQPALDQLRHRPDDVDRTDQNSDAEGRPGKLRQALVNHFRQCHRCRVEHNPASQGHENQDGKSPDNYGAREMGVAGDRPSVLVRFGRNQREIGRASCEGSGPGQGSPRTQPRDSPDAVDADRAADARTVAEDCKVILVSPLLCALMLELVAAPLDYDEHGRIGHVAALFLDEIRVLDAQPLHIPMPQDKRLRRVCEPLLGDPGRRATLEEWSAFAGANSRTLARLFARETGMRFVDWRHQIGLAEALTRLAQTHDVATVARAVGYDSASASNAMFRRTLGKIPRGYFN